MDDELYNKFLKVSRCWKSIQIALSDVATFWTDENSMKHEAMEDALLELEGVFALTAQQTPYSRVCRYTGGICWQITGQH